MTHERWAKEVARILEYWYERHCDFECLEHDSYTYDFSLSGISFSYMGSYSEYDNNPLETAYMLTEFFDKEVS